MQYSKIRKNTPQPSAIFLNKTKLIAPVSNRTFVHCLNALWINTEILLSNVILLQYFAETNDKKLTKRNQELIFFESQLTLQSQELQDLIYKSDSVPSSSQNWDNYADIWSLSNTKDFQSGLQSLRNATNMLADLYENALVLALQQPDRASALYLFAHHLMGLNEF
jgi:hypothetical protein